VPAWEETDFPALTQENRGEKTIAFDEEVMSVRFMVLSDPADGV
jgi:hypothetical protein